MKGVLKIKTLLTWVANFLIGVVGTAILVTKIIGTGQGVRGGTSSAGFDIKFDTMGLIVWAVVLVVYFFLAKKYLGKTVGGWIVSKLLGGKN